MNPGLHHAGDHICDNLDTGKKYCVKAPKGKRAIARRTTSAIDSTTGELSTVKTQLKSVLSKIQVLNLSGTDGDAVSKVEIKVQSVLSLVSAKTAPVLSTVQSKVQSVLALVQNLNIPALQAVETQLQSVVSLVENLVGGVGQLVQLQTVLAGVQTKLTSLTSVLDNAGVPVGSIQTKVTSLLTELNGSSPDLSGVQSEVQTLLSELKGYALPALQPVTSQLSGALTLVQGIIPLNLNL